MTPIVEQRIREAAARLADELIAALADLSDPTRPPRLLSVAAAAQQLGIGRSLLYSEIGAGRLRSVKAGKRRLVPESALAEYLGPAAKADPNS